MITYVNSDIFTTPARVLVNTVNTEGVMGKGLAKQFKSLFPDMFHRYQLLCEEKQIQPGVLWLYKTPNKWILNFPTKTTWRKPSKLEYIEVGLQKFVKNYSQQGITSISFPRLGCGNGELNWEKEVQPLMRKYLERLPIDVFIHVPGHEDKSFTPEHKTIADTSSWLRLEPDLLTYSEMFLDIQSVFIRTLQFHDPITKEAFEAHLEGKGIVFESNENVAHEDELIEFWTRLREFGFLMIENVPPSLYRNYSKLLAIFSHLPYCRLIQITPKTSGLKPYGNPIGLQLVPTSKKPKSSEPMNIVHLQENHDSTSKN